MMKLPYDPFLDILLRPWSSRYWWWVEKSLREYEAESQRRFKWMCRKDDLPLVTCGVSRPEKFGRTVILHPKIVLEFKDGTIVEYDSNGQIVRHDMP